MLVKMRDPLDPMRKVTMIADSGVPEAEDAI